MEKNDGQESKQCPERDRKREKFPDTRIRLAALRKPGDSEWHLLEIALRHKMKILLEERLILHIRCASDYL